ncbi:MAG: hypothetical protein ABR535_02445 [Pyrinomonadaceae bacterium]
MFYRPNFCCHCGEKIERARWTIWSSRRFCEVCETENKEHDYSIRFLAVVSIISGLFGLSGLLSLGSPPNLQSAAPVAQSRQPQAVRPVELPGTSTQAVARPQAQLALKTVSPEAKAIVERPAKNRETSFFCGALTKKGTPCSRRVKAKKDFCWQHERAAAFR